MITVGNFT